MKQSTDPEVLAEVRSHIAGNRDEIESSKYGGCVSCCAVFDVTEINAWHEEWNSTEEQNPVTRWTAKCPRCGKPSVVGSSTGLLDDQAYLPVVRHIIARQPSRHR